MIYPWKLLLASFLVAFAQQRPQTPSPVLLTWSRERGFQNVIIGPGITLTQTAKGLVMDVARPKIAVRNGDLICSGDWCEAVPRSPDLVYATAPPSSTAACPLNAIALSESGVLSFCEPRSRRWYKIQLSAH